MLDDILHRTTQSDELKDLLEGLHIFLINGWDYPKLYLPLFNTFAKKEEVRALYKGLVQIIYVDPFSSLHIFLAVVSEVIYEAETRFHDLLKVEFLVVLKIEKLEL